MILVSSQELTEGSVVKDCTWSTHKTQASQFKLLQNKRFFQRAWPSMTYAGTRISFIMPPYIYGSVKKWKETHWLTKWTAPEPTEVENLLVQIQSLWIFPLWPHRIKIYLGKKENIMSKLCVIPSRMVHMLCCTFLAESKNTRTVSPHSLECIRNAWLPVILRD